jgi:DNA-binding winged helix-turn-helix (wHTH) protein/transposase-like protein
MQMWNIQNERLPLTKIAARELPPPDTVRWTPRCKASVVKAVLSGVMSMEEVCRRYGVSVEEFRSWHNAMERHGIRGLYTTKLQKYRVSPSGRLMAQASTLAFRRPLDEIRPELRQSCAPSLVESTSFEVLMPTPAVADEEAAVRRIPLSARNRQSKIRTGDLVVDLETRVVTTDGKPVRLAGKEYSILELLSRRKGVTVTKEIFLGHLYGGKDEPELKIIDVFVCHLRKKLAQATGGKRYIETVWGRGYRLRDPAEMPSLPRS